MNAAADLLTKAKADGVILRLDPPDKLKLRGDPEVLARWAPLLKPHRAELLRLLTDVQPACDLRPSVALSPQDLERVLAALDALGEDDPEIRQEILDRCARDPEALRYWLARGPNPRQALYQAWLSGISEPRALLSLDDAQVREAVAAGVVTREAARDSVLLAYRSPAVGLGPGAVGLLAVPRAKYRDFSPMAAIEALGSIN